MKIVSIWIIHPQVTQGKKREREKKEKKKERKKKVCKIVNKDKVQFGCSVCHKEYAIHSKAGLEHTANLVKCCSPTSGRKNSFWLQKHGCGL